MPPTAKRPTAPPLPSAPSRTEAKLLLVDPRGSSAVEQHPEIVPWRLKGWTVRRAEPRVVERSGSKLLVVLEREAEEHSPGRGLSDRFEKRRFGNRNGQE